MILIRKKVATVFALGVFYLSPILALASKGAGSEELNAVANEFTGGVSSTTLKSTPLGGLGAFDGQMPDKKEVQEAVLTQGEHFVLLAALDLCRVFLSDENGRIDGLMPSVIAGHIRWGFLRAAKEAYGTDSKKYEVIEQELNAKAIWSFDEHSEMPDKKKVQEAGLTQGEHFVLLAAIDLCRGLGRPLTVRELLRAAKEAYGAGSKKYEETERALNMSDGHSEMPEEKEVHGAGLTQGEHFLLLAAIDLCSGLGWPLTVSKLLGAAKEAYGVDSKKYKVIKKGLNSINWRYGC